MPANPYRISTKLGEHSFEVEGDEAAAREDYREFLKAVKAVAAAPPPPAPITATVNGTLPAVTADIHAEVSDATSDIDASTMSRTFLLRNNVVTLAALPQSEEQVRDAVIALLYGATTMTGDTTVTALALAKALRLSGLGRDRIDREISDVVGSIITKSGAGRGTRYGLTNTGMNRAQEIIEQLLA